MAWSPRTRVTLGACIAVLLAGLAGLVWWLWYCRRRAAPGAMRFRRTRGALVVLGLLVIAVGTGSRAVAAVSRVPECVPPGGPLPATPLTAQVIAEKAATWPESGIGILYSEATGARLCFSRMKNYYVAVNADHIAGASAVVVGDVVLKPGLNLDREDLYGLVEHEARHRTQWAVGSALGGPLAFPIVYGITDFFFPGARNPFERMAGLESGFYTYSGTGPVLGPAQWAVLGAVAVAVVAVPLVRRYRRKARASGRR